MRNLHKQVSLPLNLIIRYSENCFIIFVTCHINMKRVTFSLHLKRVLENVGSEKSKSKLRWSILLPKGKVILALKSLQRGILLAKILVLNIFTSNFFFNKPVICIWIIVLYMFSKSPKYYNTLGYKKGFPNLIRRSVSP